QNTECFDLPALLSRAKRSMKLHQALTTNVPTRLLFPYWAFAIRLAQKPLATGANELLCACASSMSLAV
ncbi:MAG: hypothetical protein M3014_01275, partial [Chloroflexota bacterium]|nr:hypothetical protein [Chloroflexota bacterium]